MIYVNAFILGGFTCLIFQCLQTYLKLSLSKIMIIAVLIGAILAATGIMPILTSWGGVGMMVMIVGLGEAFYNATMAVTGTFAPFIVILLVVVVFFMLGLLTALFNLKINKKKIRNKNN